MAISKTLILLVALTCLVETASASVMLEKWMNLFNNLTLNEFIKAMLWLLWSTLGPLLSGLISVVAHEQWVGFTDDIKYGMCVAGVCRLDDLVAYSANMVLYTIIMPILGVTYTSDEFVELDTSALGQGPP